MSLKTKSMLIGGAIGVAVGVVAGWLYFNTNVKYNQEGLEQLEGPAPGDTLKLSLSLLGLLRMFTE